MASYQINSFPATLAVIIKNIKKTRCLKTLLRPYTVTALIGAAVLSACWFGDSPTKLNQQIEEGKPAKALSAIEEKLASDPTDPALNLLAVKARIALCRQRNCITETPGITPPLLAGLPKLTAHITGPVTLAKDVSPLTISGVFTDAMARYEVMPGQPDAVLMLYNSAPAGLQPKLARGLFQPALKHARDGDFARAAQTLEGVTKAEGLPTTYGYAAHMLGGMMGHDTLNKDSNLIALRSVATPPLPETAAALLPWAILTEATSTASNTTPAAVLATLPQRITALKLTTMLDTKAMGAIARELVATSNTPTAAAQWAGGWSGTPQSLNLALQRTALSIDPNQPELWTTYLPALVAATITQSSSSLAGLTDSGSAIDMPTVTLASSTTPRVAAEVLKAAGQLINYPGVATPLITFVSRLPLGKQQQIDLEKLSQSLLIKAAEQGDVTSTVILAKTLPGVAQNNRQSVVPLLVKYIREKLRSGDFTAATGIAELLTNTLKMDIEFAPLVLEEFADDVKRRKIAEELTADTPEVLLKPADTVTLDLGPLFTFMQSYFQDQPKVITAQLTTLIAEADGTYGKPTAMYRLGPNFPESTLSADKQKEWLGASLEQALMTDTSLTAVTLAETSAKLAVVHPQLNLAPLLETAIKRAGTLEDQRTLWQAATPQVKEVLRAIRPEFTLLMQGVDAMAASQLNTAAQAFAGITDAQWRNEAKPFIEQFNERLVTLSGIYVPVSAAPALKTAALILAPHGLTGGKLTTVSVTFVSRVGTLNENEPVALRTNAAATHRFTLPTVYNFDTRSLAITTQAVAQAPSGGTFGTTYGNIRGIKMQGEDTDNPVLNVTLADGSSTPFIRTLLDPTQPLRPDGTYLMQSRLGQQVSSTQNILPPGSMLTLATGTDTQSAPTDADISLTEVYPLTGTLRHPASAQPITFTGFYEAATLTSTFTINYPLPVSTQPARAAVRCQALAGPITCGAHNLNSARQAYAALVTGLQTRESLATSSANRNQLNSITATRILTDAIPIITIPSTTLTVSSTGGLASATATVSATLAVSGTTTSVTIALPSPTTLVSNLLPAPALADDPEEEDISTSAPTTPKKPVSTEPELGAFVNNSGGKKSPSSPSATTVQDAAATDPNAPAPGAFINHSGAKPVAVTPTTPTH